MKIIAYLHTHWDREWYRTFEEFRFRFAEVFEDIIKKLETGDFKQFYLDGQTILVDDLLEIFPEKKGLLQKLIAEKKLVIGPWYTLADEFLVSGESLIRNLFIGSIQAKEYGVEDFCGYLPDAFGHTQGMVDILASFGIKKALLWRGTGSLPSEFWWKSKSGAQIEVTHLVEGYFEDYFASEAPYEGAKSFVDKVKARNIGDLMLLPIGADHLGAADNLPAKIEEFNSKSEDKIEVGSVFDYLKNSKENLETFQGELRDNSKNFILQGTYSTRNYLKRLNALTTAKLKKIEALDALCAESGASKSYKEFVTYAWKLLLQNHAHDSICGCSVDAVHREMETRFAKIDQLLETIKEKILTNFGDGDDLLAFNSSGFDFSGVAEIHTQKKLAKSDGYEFVEKKIEFPQAIVQNIQKIPVSEDLAPIYTYIANLKNVKSLGLSKVEPVLESDLQITKRSIENNFLTLKVEKNGSITLKDKQNGKTYTDAIVFEDCADIGDTYNFSPIKEDEKQAAKLIKSKVFWEGNARCVLQLRHEIEIPKTSEKTGRHEEKIPHKITTQVILDAGSKVLKFKTEFKNKSKRHLLQVRFNLPEAVTKTFSEDSIGLIERDFDPNYNIKSEKPAEIFHELKHNTAPLQRFLWAQNFGILTKGLHEYEIHRNKLSITLLRAVGMLSGRELHSRYNAAGPTIATKEAQCLRDLECEFALTFTSAPQKMFSVADAYYEPIVAFFGQEKTTEFTPTLQNDNIVVFAAKSPQTGTGVVLRLLNISGEEQKTSLFGKNLSALEEQLDDTPQTIVLKPYELKTVLICQSSAK